MTFLIILAGCSVGTSVDKQIMEVITNLNQAEMEYQEAQETLFEFEQQEQQLFNETMKLTKDQHEELSAQVTELKELLGQRLAFLEKEEMSIENARKSISEFDAVIGNADENDKNMIEELKSVVNERYELHESFVAEYKELAKLQERLYEMLVDDGTGLSKLKRQVNEVNLQNGEVQAAIISFNEATGKVNKLKDEVISDIQDHK